MNRTRTFACDSGRLLASLALIAASAHSAFGRDDSADIILQAIRSTCLDCHNTETSEGDLDLSAIRFEPNDNVNRSLWVAVHDRIDRHEMPPDSNAFADGPRNQLLKRLRNALHRADYADVRKSGRGPARRLTREEYENNLCDLLRLPALDVRDKLPADRDSHGYTRVSRLLDMSRVQLEGYLDAAEAALATAVATGVEPIEPTHFRAVGTDLFPALQTFGQREAMFFARNGKLVAISNETFQAMSPAERRDDTLEMALFRSATWPYFGYPRGFRAKHTGAYRVRFKARAVRQVRDFRIVPAYDSLPMTFRARQPSGPDVSGDVRETGGWMDLEPEPKVFETTIYLKRGETFEYSLLGLPVPFIRTDGGFFYDFPPMPRDGHRGAAIEWLEVDGPVSSDRWPSESHGVLFDDLPITPAAKGSRWGVNVVTQKPAKDAQRLFGRFAPLAARRPVARQTISRYVGLIHSALDEGASFVDAMLHGYLAFLCSGHVIYLPEPSPAGTGDNVSPIASRLSHLLWSSRPDARLTELAADRSLVQLDVLRRQTDRLIGDSKFDRFVADFTSQWLDLKRLRQDIPDNRLYPEYRKDDYLVDSMEKETLAFFRAMVRENLPITTAVDADFTFVNDRLARHYDLPRTSGSGMRKTMLPNESPYGGLLTQASILKLTANGTTTSPVLRGVWVMEKLMGDPPPPPPTSVPAIEPDIRGASTIRDQLAKHAESKTCSACHARFDPIGFALENFDVMGAWRDRYRGLEKGEKVTGVDPAGHPYLYFVGQSIDASGRLNDGAAFDDVRELKSHLTADPRQLARNFVGQLTLYATGTPPRFSDRRVIDSILDQTEKDGYRVRDLLHGLIASRIFRGQPAP